MVSKYQNVLNQKAYQLFYRLAKDKTYNDAYATDDSQSNEDTWLKKVTNVFKFCEDGWPNWHWISK